MSPQPSKAYPETYSRLSAGIDKQVKELRDRIKKSEAKVRNFRVASDLEIIRPKQSTAAQIKLEGLIDYFKMRRSWDVFLKSCLAVILGFNIVLVYLTGTDRLVFADEWFLRIVLTTNFADIIGLVYLEVRFLFPNQISESKKDQ